MNTRNRGQELTTAADGLLALSVAEHAKDKEYALLNISRIFTKAMKDKWPGRLYYVDPFCGPGRCVVRSLSEETTGSPLIAMGVPFNHYFFADSDDDCVDALKHRVHADNTTGQIVRYYTGEAHDTIRDIVGDLPPARKSLGLAFMDPWAWDFAFQDLKSLTAGRRLDLLINFNIGDMKRRWKEESAKLDSFLNLTADHREVFRTKTKGIPDTRTLLDHYERELEKIGYTYIADDRPVTNSKNTPLYHLIFGSKHPLGKELRDEVSKRTASGQLKMFV